MPRLVWISVCGAGALAGAEDVEVASVDAEVEDGDVVVD